MEESKIKEVINKLVVEKMLVRDMNNIDFGVGDYVYDPDDKRVYKVKDAFLSGTFRPYADEDTEMVSVVSLYGKYKYDLEAATVKRIDKEDIEEYI